MESKPLTVGNVFLKESIQAFKSMKTNGDKAIAQLTDDELHWLPDPESNNVCIIVKHMYGNMLSRFTDFLTADGEKPDRNRDEEFIARQEDKEQLTSMWEQGWAAVFRALEKLTEEDLLKTVYIRNEPHTVIQAIQRQVSHYSYHIGQIVFLAKMIKSSEWQTLSIPKGGSRQFNEQMMKRG